MAFTGDFTVEQITLSDVTVNDTSTGSDDTITTRRIYFRQYDNTTIVPEGVTTDYVEFPLDAGNSILIENLLLRDYALSIEVVWITPTPDPDGVYDVTKSYLFTYYSETFYYGLTQTQTSSPQIVNDTPYYKNKSLLRTLIDDADQSIRFGTDLYSAQINLNAAFFMMQNQLFYF